MGQIHTGIFAVLALYDRYSGTPVKDGQVQVFVKPEMKVIYKEGGYAVILQEPGIEEAEVTLSSRIFQKRTFSCRRKENPCVQVLWMEPQRNYPFPAGAVFVTGNATAGAYLTFEKETQAVHLLADYEKGCREIRLYGLPQQVKGTEYVFWKNGMAVSDIWEITDFREGCREENLVLLKEPLAKSFRKNEVEVRRVYPVLRDGNGSFFMAFDMGNESLIFLS